MNQVELVCETTGVVKENHIISNNAGSCIQMMEVDVSCISKTGQVNHLSIHLPKNSRMLSILEDKDSIIRLKGKFASFRKTIGEKRIQEMYISPISVEKVEETYDHLNNLSFIGEVIKTPVFKRRKNGRRVAEAIVKIPKENQRGYDFIPIVSFDHLAGKMKSLKAGSIVKGNGRIHSREYNETNTQYKSTKRKAYEVCVHSIIELKKRNSESKAILFKEQRHSS